MYKSLFDQLGFTRTQSKLYLLVLSSGPSSAIQLSQKTGLTRQAVHMLMRELMARNLICKVKIDGRPRFEAADPEVLQEILHDLATEAKEAITYLKTRQVGRPGLPVVTVYDTPKKMREWFKAFITDAKKGEELLMRTSKGDWQQLDPIFYTRFAEMKQQKQIKERIIAPALVKGEKSPNKEYRHHPDDWPNTSEKWIWRDQIVLLTLNENAPNWLVIESKNLAETERSDFELIWKSLA